MSGISTEDYEAGVSSSPTEGMSAGQRCQSIDSLAEWRSSEQVENGIPSTSPPFWDTDDDDECGPKPSELFGKFTWKIENFRQLNKRELRSNAFEVGGYKWYILIYPQGCDVCNHLSLFLCVANHDKLLPGWSHFAQFTIAVVNKDPKKSKFSDTLHRFWKKEHDWGWKKFMEINKVYDGFVNDDTLVIKAQVQVIREKANRPFRCLDCQYRRELVRVYLSNVEQICRRFIEDRKNKLGKLIEDKMRWSSFRAFWTGIDQASRRRMSRDKSDTILRVVVKHFFVEKEVTSTLVMDSLHSGLKALEHQSKNKKGKLKIEMGDSCDPMVRVEKDMFVLDDDVVLLLDRVASEPLPTTSLPPKDDKVSLNRAKEGSCCEEFNKESIERDERRLTELGQRTVEIFVVAHIFSRIEVAYQEAVALKRQEELIREEEAAGQAEHELKAKRAAADKEKRAKKKQTKQKRNNRKIKDQQRDLKSVLTLKGRQLENSADDIVSCELSSNREQFMSEKMDTPEDAPEDASDVSYAGEDVTEPLHHDLDDRDDSPVNWDTDASEVHPCMKVRLTENSNEQMEKRNPIIDDSSSTCSTDSVPSVVSNGLYKGFSGHNNRIHTSPNRGKNQLGKALLSQETIAGHFGDALGSGGSCHGMESDAAHFKHSILYADKCLIEKREETATVQKKIVIKEEDAKRISLTSTVEVSSASTRSGRKTKPLLQQPKKLLESSTTPTASVTEPVLIKEPYPTNPTLTAKPASIPAKSAQSSSSKSEAQRIASIHVPKGTTAPPFNTISRPSSAPLIPAASRPTRPIVSKVQKLPQLSRSVSAAGRLGIDPSPSAPSCVPQSYRNAIIGKTTMGSSTAGLSHSASVSLIEAPSTSSSQSASSITSSSMLPPTPGARKEHQMNCRPTFTFGSVKPDALPNHHERKDDGLHQAATTSRSTTTTTTTTPTPTPTTSSGLVNGIERLEICDEKQLLCSSTPLVQSPLGGVVEEFPHIDIINDLLDEEQSSMGSREELYYPHHHLHQSFSRQYTFPGDISSSDLSLLANHSGRYEQTEQYYDDGFQNLYSSSSVSPLHRLREGQFPHMDLSASYAISPLDGMVQIHWPYSHADLSTVNLGNTGTDGYSYQQFSDYSSLGRGANGYGMYRP